MEERRRTRADIRSEAGPSRANYTSSNSIVADGGCCPWSRNNKNKVADMKSEKQRHKEEISRRLDKEMDLNNRLNKEKRDHKLMKANLEGKIDDMKKELQAAMKEKVEYKEQLAEERMRYEKEEKHHAETRAQLQREIDELKKNLLSKVEEELQKEKNMGLGERVGKSVDKKFGSLVSKKSS